MPKTMKIIKLSPELMAQATATASCAVEEIKTFAGYYLETTEITVNSPTIKLNSIKRN